MMARHARRRRYLAAILTILIVVIWAFTLRPVSLGGPAGYVIIDGSSMEPTYQNHDLVITRKLGSYQVGDVIAYSPSTDAFSGASLTIHRIIGVDETGAYLTQGDNRPIPDQWVARPSDTLGKAWIHIPHVGGWILRMQQPENLRIILAGFIGLSVLGGSKAKRRRRRNGDGRTVNDNQQWMPQLPLSGRALVAMAVLAVLALGFLVLGFVSFRRPTHETIVQEHPHHEHTASFDYTVAMNPSTLYPDGIVGPIEPDETTRLAGPDVSTPDAGTVEAELDESGAEVPPIYLKLARTMDLGVSYALQTDLPSDVRGVYSADLHIKAGDEGWEKTEALILPTEFNGPDVDFRVPVDFAALTAEITTVEEETGFSPGNYTISVTPTIEIFGEIDGQPVEESFAPVFSMAFDNVVITPDSQLSRVDARTISETLTFEKQVAFTGVVMPVTTARLLSVAGLFLSLSAVAVLVYLAVQRIKEDEHRMIQVRHGSMLVDVSDTEGVEDFLERVRLASMRDLTRLAQRDGQIIFHQDRGSEGHRYFVPDGTVVYEYSVPNGRPNGGSPNGATVIANGIVKSQTKARQNDDVRLRSIRRSDHGEEGD